MKLLFIGGHLDGELVEVNRPGYPWNTIEDTGPLGEFRQVMYRPFEFRLFEAKRITVMLVEGTPYNHSASVELAITAICKRAGVTVEAP